MLSLYAQSFMIATRTDQSQRADAVPGQPSRGGARPAATSRRELPHLGLRRNTATVIGFDQDGTGMPD